MGIFPALFFLLLIVLLTRVSFLRSGWFCMSCVSAASLGCMIEGTWGCNVHDSIPFIIVILCLMACLAQRIIFGLKTGKSVCALLGHSGFFTILFAAFFGALDIREGQMVASRDTEVRYAVGEKGDMLLLPFSVRLEDFTTEYYDDGKSPKQYRSVLEITGPDDATVQKTVEVNSPAAYKGWMICQAGYDDGSSILKVVKNPWLPLVYAGMVLLVCGSFLHSGRKWRKGAFIPAVLALAAVFGIVSLARINFGTLMPVLRSMWFVPHVLIYMLAYSTLSLSFVLHAINCFGKDKPQCTEYASRLLSLSSTFLVTGMLCGAVWAQRAWGDWWNWDAKECWAAATWMLTAAAMHIHTGKRTATAMIFAAFLAMQITWYGINHLPAAAKSLHTYFINSD